MLVGRYGPHGRLSVTCHCVNHLTVMRERVNTISVVESYDVGRVHDWGSKYTLLGLPYTVVTSLIWWSVGTC